MKVYKFTSYIEKEYAILRPSSKQNIKEINFRKEIIKNGKK